MASKWWVIGGVLLLAILVFGAVGVWAATTYYVATTGSDTHGDGTENWVDNDSSGNWSAGDTGPWLTISHALNQVSAGDTIIVGPGTYVEYTGPVSGGCAVQVPCYAEGAGGLTIQSSGGATNTIIDCGWAGWGVQINSNNITFTGFTVKNADSVINQVSGNDHTLSNLIITDFVNYGLGIYHGVGCQFNDITIHTNDVANSNNRIVKGIDMQGYGSGGNSGNSFEDITIYDIETTGTSGTSIGIWWSASSTFTESGNTFTDVTIHDLTAENWLACGIYITGSGGNTNNQFENITIYNIETYETAYGIYITGSGSYTNNQFEDITIYNIETYETAGGINITGSGGYTNNQFEDITIYNIETYEAAYGINITNSGGHTNNQFENITIYNIKTTGDSGYSGTTIGIYWYTSETSTDSGNTFINVTIHDLSFVNWTACGIYIWGRTPGATPYAIENTIFSGGNIYNIGGGVDYTRGFYVAGGCKDLSISGFEITGCEKGIYFSHHEFEACKNIDIHFNNIVGNTEYGVQDYDGDNDVNAENNWWGDATGPYHPTTNPGGTGDAVSDNVDYDPWLMEEDGTETEETESETITGSGTMEDTPTGGDVTIDATGDHTVTVAKYAENPGGTTPFSAADNYYDVHLDDTTGVNSLTIEFCPATASTIIYYWDETSSSWQRASDQTYASGCIVVTITDSTSPSLSDLTGLPFGSSEVTLGDINDDGPINVLDARLCLQIATGFITPTAAQEAAADVDGDGDVDLDDAELLAKYIIGMEEKLGGE